MFDRPIKSIMERDRFLTAPPQTTVSDAARLMATRNAGAVLVVANESLVGIFTERDIVFRVIAKDLDPATTHLDTVMTPSPLTLEPSRAVAPSASFRHATRWIPSLRISFRNSVGVNTTAETAFPSHRPGTAALPVPSCKRNLPQAQGPNPC